MSRFKTIFHFALKVTGRLKWLFFGIFIVGTLAGFPNLGRFSLLFLFLSFIEPPTLQAIYQLVGMAYVAVRNIGTGFPSTENYTCKCTYILPFKGKWTVVNGGFDKSLSHSWGVYSQRYAYDFLILDDKGRTFDGHGTVVKDYFCYGMDIIAPADGVVVKCQDSHTDSRVDGKNVYCDSFDLRGNHIVIWHAEGEYSCIAHIMPKSLTVKVGTVVKQGDLVAKCGNSGNSSQPHIHFQLQKSRSFFFTVGLPIAFGNISAERKKSYPMFDERPCVGNFMRGDSGRTYIARGLEVWNRE